MTTLHLLRSPEPFDRLDFMSDGFSPRHPLFSDGTTSFPKEKHGLVLIVRAASQLDVSHGRGSAVGVRHNVMKLEKRRLGAAPCAADERAAPLVAAPDLALDRWGNVSSMTFVFRVLPRPGRGATPSLLDIGDQQSQGAVEDGSDIAIGDGVPQKVPGAA